LATNEKPLFEGSARCIERFKSNELSIQLGQADTGDAQRLKTGSLVVTKTRRRHFLAIQSPNPQRFAYIDLEDWRLADAPPDAFFEVHNDWMFLRGWDSMLVHEFHRRLRFSGQQKIPAGLWMHEDAMR
jgi:hypothetical protein